LDSGALQADKRASRGWSSRVLSKRAASWVVPHWPPAGLSFETDPARAAPTDGGVKSGAPEEIGAPRAARTVVIVSVRVMHPQPQVNSKYSILLYANRKLRWISLRKQVNLAQRTKIHV
jgi:hypothetical protein